MGVRRHTGWRGAAGCRAGLRARLLLCLKLIGSFDDPIDAAVKDDQLVVGVDDNGCGDAAHEKNFLLSLQLPLPPSVVPSSVAPSRFLRPTSKTFRVQWPFYRTRWREYRSGCNQQRVCLSTFYGSLSRNIKYTCLQVLSMPPPVFRLEPSVDSLSPD